MFAIEFLHKVENGYDTFVANQEMEDDFRETAPYFGLIIWLFGGAKVAEAGHCWFCYS